MSARSEVIGHKAGEFFTKGVMRMMTVAMPGREEPTEVEIIEKVAVEDIDPNPLNRTEFDEGKLAEMVESLREHGQTTAAIVRPKADGRLELVAGERRLRGCKLAGIETLDCVVRTYSDTQAAEILLIENLEREDLKPTEEARIYQRLLELKDESGAKLYTLEKIAARVHNDVRKVDRVSRVLSILNLPPPVKKALDANQIGVNVAYLVARIADPEDRKEAGEMVLKGQHGQGTMTRVQAADYIARTFQVNLRSAKFDREDPDILSAEEKVELGYTGAAGEKNDGSCERCPWLAKNHVVYREELSTKGQGVAGVARGSGIDPLTCTRAKCHEVKLEALWQREAAVFAKKHEAVRVLTRRESESVDRWNSDWVVLDDKPTMNETGDWDAAREAPTWAKLIKGAGVPLVVARNTDEIESGGAPMLVVEKALAIEAAKKARPDLFEKAKVVGQSGSKVVLSEEEVEAQKKLEFDRKVDSAVQERLKRVVLEELMHSIENGGLALEGYRGLFDSISRNVDHIGALATWVLPGHTNEDEWPEKEMNEYLSAVNSDGKLALCVVASVLDDVMYSGPERAEDFQTIAKAQGIEIKAIRKRVEKEVKRKLEAEAKAAEAEEKAKVQRGNRNKIEEIQKRSILEGEKDAEDTPSHEGTEEAKAQRVLAVVTTEKAEFAENLMGLTVLPSVANEAGVFTAPVVVTYRRGKVWCSIELACDEGHWYVGYRYGGKPIEKVNSGSGLPNLNWSYASRREAVLHELEAMIDHLEVPFKGIIEDFKDVRALVELHEMVKVEESVEESVDEVVAEEVPETGKRGAMPEAEKVAWESYLETGSIAEAAKAAGLALDTVKNWHKRRKWKAMRLATVGG